MTDVPMFAVQRFWTEYKPSKTDPAKMEAIDWVAYGPMGHTDRSLTHSQIRHLNCLKPNAPSDDVAAKMARMIWEHIRPLYEAWKSGQEMPETGTPLAAWSGIPPEMASVFRARGVRSVEDVANLNDTHIQAFGLPGMRDVIASAKLFLKSADATRATAEMKRRDDEIATLKEQLAQLTEAVKSQADAPIKRGPGRPPKEASV